MEYYENDLTPEESLVDLETADAILATTLQGREWTARAVADRQACLDDPERAPARDDDKAALRDASAALASQMWRGRKVSEAQTQPFPRAGMALDTGKVVFGTPVAIKHATAILAAHLLKQADQPLSGETLQSYRIGETSGVFRAPSLDRLPYPVRQLIAPFLNGGTSWTPIRP